MGLMSIHKQKRILRISDLAAGRQFTEYSLHDLFIRHTHSTRTR
jgi:hypothetical protein